jgi:hypothetical protein
MPLPFADAFLPGRAILTRLSAGHRGTCEKRYRLPKGQVKKKWRRRVLEALQRVLEEQGDGQGTDGPLPPGSRGTETLA